MKKKCKESRLRVNRASHVRLSEKGKQGFTCLSEKDKHKTEEGFTCACEAVNRRVIVRNEDLLSKNCTIFIPMNSLYMRAFQKEKNTVGVRWGIY